MTTPLRRLIRRTSRLSLPLALAAGAWVYAPTSALGQAGPDPTAGFFDVPKRDTPPAWGLPEYMMTSVFAGAAIFMLCKSARRT